MGRPAAIMTLKFLANIILSCAEILLISKVTAYKSRKASIKGQKDLIDIVSLIASENFDFSYFKNLIKNYNLNTNLELLKEIFTITKEIPELNFNQHGFSKLKKDILENL